MEFGWLHKEWVDGLSFQIMASRSSLVTGERLVACFSHTLAIIWDKKPLVMVDLGLC